MRRPERVAEGNEPAPLLVPQGKAQAFEAVDQREALGILKLANLLEAGVQAVVRDVARDMMDMVKADRGGQPAQHCRKIVEGASLHRGRVEIPSLAGFP